VLAFAASNFPFAFSILRGDTASALAVGAPAGRVSAAIIEEYGAAGN
jgi:hypothetical protein